MARKPNVNISENTINENENINEYVKENENSINEEQNQEVKPTKKSDNFGVYFNRVNETLMFGERKQFVKGYVNIETEDEFNALSKTEDYLNGYITKK
ncbi:MAG TPA: hypothetical protein PLQ36_00620 [Candidatus Gracilibacteria bacterium]|nr:hypothetical protein [Candidatus Gracilibacteria bacterium]